MNDFTKSGEFIASLRKERGLTQSELAAMVGVGDKSVSKWERGINVPDVLVLKSLAKIFNVSVCEILAGERKEKLDPEIVKIYENKYIRYSVIGVLIIFSISFLALLIYFCNNYDKSRVYRFKGENDNYSISGNIFLVGDERKLIIDDFEIYDKDKYDKLLISEYKVNIYFETDLISSFSKISSSTTSNLYFTYDQVIDNVSRSELLLNDFNCKNTTGDGHMEIEFINGEEICIENFSFSYSLKTRNNRFFYKK